MTRVHLVAAWLVTTSAMLGAPDPATVSSNDFPHSEAVTLLDETKVDVAADASFSALRHVRSKVLTPRGRRAAETVIPFNAELQQVEVHFAKATLADGSEAALKPADIQTILLRPGNPAYNDVKAVGYRIRGVEVGTVLDQEYVLKSKPQMHDQFWMIWRPRSAQPLYQAQLVVRVPAARKFRWRMHNLDIQPQVTDSEDKQWKTYTWSYAAPTELSAEPYMPSPDEFVPWLEITTVESWEQLAKWLDDVTAPQIDSSPEFQARVQGLTAGLTNDLDKAAALFYWVEDNFPYVGIDLGVAGYKPRAASQVIQTRYGDAKDLSALLAALLRDAGIPARLALLESGSARKISDRLPMPRHLTHCVVVAEVNGKTLYLDPTAETARVETVLGRLCNTELLLLGKGANQWAPGPAYDGRQHGTLERIKLRLAADGSVEGELRIEYLGESDAFIRSAFKKFPGVGQVRELMDREIRKNLPGGRLIDCDVADPAQRTRNFVTQARFDAAEWAAIEGEKLRFKPQLQQQIRVSDEWLTKGDRAFPIQFYESAPSISEIEITLPDGFVAESLPKDVEFDNAFSHWKRKVQQNGNRLVIHEASHLKTARLPKESIADIRKYYDEATARKNDEIVLKKK